MPFAVAAGIGAAGSIASGVIGANAAGSAAQTQADAANRASQVEQQQFQQTQGNLAPYMGAGTNALTALQAALGIGPGGTGGPNAAALTSSPGYQFQLQQGLSGVQNAASASGGNMSGNTLKAITQYGQGLADTTWQQYLGNLTGLVGTGQNAANATGQFGANAAGQIGNNTIGGGNALAAGQVGAASNIAGGINGVGQNALNYAYNSQLPWFQQPAGGSMANNPINLYQTPVNMPMAYNPVTGYGG